VQIVAEGGVNLNGKISADRRVALFESLLRILRHVNLIGKKRLSASSR